MPLASNVGQCAFHLTRPERILTGSSSLNLPHSRSVADIPDRVPAPVCQQGPRTSRLAGPFAIADGSEKGNSSPVVTRPSSLATGFSHRRRLGPIFSLARESVGPMLFFRNAHERTDFLVTFSSRWYIRTTSASEPSSSSSGQFHFFAILQKHRSRRNGRPNGAAAAERRLVGVGLGTFFLRADAPRSGASRRCGCVARLLSPRKCRNTAKSSFTKVRKTSAARSSRSSFDSRIERAWAEWLTTWITSPHE